MKNEKWTLLGQIAAAASVYIAIGLVLLLIIAGAAKWAWGQLFG